MNDSFFKRLKSHVLAGRDVHIWGKTLGISSGAVDGLLQGAVPGIDIQLAMQHKENCNLTFLNTGKGQPFNVHDFSTSQAAIDYVAELLITAPWNIYIVRADNLITLVFQQPGQYEYKSNFIDHDECEVLVAQYSEALYKYLSTKLELNKVYFPKLSDDVVEQITSGAIGTFALFGDKKSSGILNHSGLSAPVLEQLPPVTGSEVNNAERQLMQAVIRLMEQSIIESRVKLSVEDREKVIRAGYAYAVKSGASATTLTPQGILAILDSILE